MSKANESPYARELSGGFQRLRFEPPLEQDFRVDYLAQNVQRLRMTLTIGMIFTAVLAVLDWRLVPTDIRGPLLIIRLAITVPVLLVAAAATFPGFLARFLSHLVPLAAGVTSAAALGIAWLSLNETRMLPVASVVATTCFVYMMLGLRLPVALPIALFMLGAYALIGLGYGSPSAEFAYELVGLSFINVAGAYGCYRFEHASRTSFLKKEIVNILAGSDALTGIPNRRMFNSHLQRIWLQAVRESRGLAVAIIELDHFRAYVDRYGQQGADATFRRVAHTVMSCARRPLDFCARFSNEELALVLYDPGQAYVQPLAVRIRDRVAMLDIPHEASDTSERVTVSIGLAMAPPGERDDPKSLLELADSALTEVKQAGGNGVVARDSTAATAGRVLRGPWQAANE